MKKYLLLLLIILVLVPVFGQETTPRSVLQKVALDDGSTPAITFAEEVSAKEYTVRTWMASHPQDVLSTETHSTWHVNMILVGDDVEYPITAVVIIELGNFPTQWEVGDTLHTEVIHKASQESTSWSTVIPAGEDPIFLLDTAQIIPPFTKVKEIKPELE